MVMFSIGLGNASLQRSCANESSAMYANFKIRATYNLKMLLMCSKALLTALFSVVYVESTTL